MMLDMTDDSKIVRFCVVNGCDSKAVDRGFCAFHLAPHKELARSLSETSKAGLDMSDRIPTEAECRASEKWCDWPETDGTVATELDCPDTAPCGLAVTAEEGPGLMSVDTAAPSNGKSNRSYNNCEGKDTIAEVIEIVPELAATVTKEPLYTAMGEMVPKAFATIRTYPNGVRQSIGVVGERYQVVQDSRAFEIVGALLDKGLIHKVNGGAYQGRTWLYGEAGTAEVSRGDAVSLRVLFGNSHDGSLKLGIGMPSIRVVCQNTMLHAMQNSAKLLKLRHTVGVDGLIDQFQEALQVGGAEFLSSVDKMRAMQATKISESQLKEYTGYVFSQWADQDNEDEQDDKAGQRVYVKIAQNHEAGIGADMARGTVWGAYNAVTQYLTHERGRGNDASRFADSNWGEGAKLGQRAWTGASNMIGA